MKQKDYIIILAWPKTPAKAIGRWYDPLLKVLGILNGYYIAGHAAAVIVNNETKECHYFDFGRYHMPQKFGRARSKLTDPSLEIKTKAIISDTNNILNIEEILKELYNNKNCHGKGVLYASILKNISFEKAFNYASSIQNKNAVPYGPYNYLGTNCSRFITSIALKSNPTKKIKFRLSTPLLFTPLTKANVLACNNYFYKVLNNKISKQKVRYKDQLKNYMLPFFIRREKRSDKSQIKASFYLQKNSKIKYAKQT